MDSEEGTARLLSDVRVDVRVKLAALWTAHFLLWTFGDMMSLLQQTAEPLTETVFLVVAPTTAIVQALMIVFCLIGPAKYGRLVNLIVASVFLLFNIGYLAEPYNVGWNYYLGAAYVLFSLLLLWTAWTWPRVEEGDPRSASRPR